MIKTKVLSKESSSKFIERMRLSKSKGESKYKELYSYLESLEEHHGNALLTLVLPVFNEEDTIKELFEDLPNHPLIEIIAVNDGSSDKSLEELEKVKRFKNIKIVNHRRNIGYGATIITGVKTAKGKVIVTMDADGQHSADDIYNLIKPIFEGEADFTIGSRYLGTYYYDLPITTRLGEIVLEKLIQILFGIKIMNNQNGFRAFNKKILDIFEKVKYPGYAFCTEQICKARMRGYKIKECPIKLYDREYGESKIVLWNLAIQLFCCVFIYFGKKIFRKMFRRTK
ncbi:MAG: glycosyltransferase family 2 protein [Promethearchaeota archaeon]|nr:MAG: glycosyltransferase family 2 protein [Candidatus Lokiarchaeota archaeon]